MIEINLLPEELRKKQMPKLAMPDIPVAGVKIGVVVFLGLHALVVLTVILMNARLGAMRTEAGELGQMNRQITSQKAQTIAMQSRLKQIDGLTQRKFLWTSLLNALSDSTIKGVWLNRLSVVEKKEKTIAKQAKNMIPGKKSPAAGMRVVGGESKSAPAKATAAKSKSAAFFKVLHIEGSVVGQGRETETVGRFIQEIENNKLFTELFSDIELVNMFHKKIKEHDVYEFLIECWYYPEKAPAGSSYGG